MILIRWVLPDPDSFWLLHIKSYSPAVPLHHREEWPSSPPPPVLFEKSSVPRAGHSALSPCWVGFCAGRSEPSHALCHALRPLLGAPVSGGGCSPSLQPGRPSRSCEVSVFHFVPATEGPPLSLQNEGRSPKTS